MEKKRELLPLVNNATIALSNMTRDAANLEYHDNSTASRQLKKAIVDFENNELKALKDAVLEVRRDINSRPKRLKPNQKINLENLKQNQNKS